MYGYTIHFSYALQNDHCVFKLEAEEFIVSLKIWEELLNENLVQSSDNFLVMWTSFVKNKNIPKWIKDRIYCLMLGLQEADKKVKANRSFSSMLCFEAISNRTLKRTKCSILWNGNWTVEMGPSANISCCQEKRK